MIYTGYFGNIRHYPINGYIEGNICEEQYTEVFKKENLSHLDVHFFGKLYQNCVLLCYEKLSSFCHRQIVSQWFNDNGYECKEVGTL